jgi:hypothetical protein
MHKPIGFLVLYTTLAQGAKNPSDPKKQSKPKKSLDLRIKLRKITNAAAQQSKKQI